MKHIIKGAVLLGILLCTSLFVKGQDDNANSNITGIDSLVNVAYGTVNENDLSSAISVLKPREYLDKHHGMYPLEGSSAFIGGSNLWGLGSALVLIDGVPRSVSNITSSEIDQISFLKGANAVVLYGSRAANGVILITTKRGKIGETLSEVRVNAGVNTPKAFPDYLGSADYMTSYNQALLNDGLEPLYNEETINNYASQQNPYLYPDVDYYSSDYIKRTINHYSASADFSGGNERARFYAMTGYESVNSLLNIGQGANEGGSRLNVRGNIDLQLNDYISTYVNVSTIFYDFRSANGNYWNNAATIQPHRFSPFVPIDMIQKGAEDAHVLVDASRHIIDDKYLLGGSQEYLTNPIADALVAGHNTYTSRQFQYSSGVDINLEKLLTGLTFHSQMSIDYSNSYSQSVNNTYAVYVPTWNSTDVADSISSLEKFNKDSNTGTQNLGGNWNSQVLDFNMYFNYANTFNRVHSVSGMLLAAGYRGRQTGDYQNRTNTNLGIQVAYNYNNKYYVDFSGAVVNSTKLPKNTRVAFSPTVNLAWVISDEDFMGESNVVNRLKISASAGILNTDIGFNQYYMYDANYASTAYFSWSDGAYVNQATTVSRGENLNLDYVKRKELSLGLDGLFFDNILSLKANAFIIKKDGLPVQSYTRFPSYFRTFWPETSFVPYTNFEANSYRGFDFQLAVNKQVGEVDLTLGWSGTFMSTKALVREELFEDKYRNRAGKPTDAMFGLESDGLFMSQDEIDDHATQRFGEVKPGDIKYIDQNNDGIVDERDEVMLGKWGSPFSTGMHFTAEWKDFTFFVLGTASFGGTGMTTNNYYWVYGDRKYSGVVRDSWTEENQSTASYPRLTTLSGDNNFRSSDFWTYNTNRINLSKVQLTYTIPQRLIDNSFVKELKFHVNGANLLTLSKNKDIMDLNVGSTPQMRLFNLGVKAVF